ncbi:hypothetical protein KCU91_g9, partial [Aureobasidium melanogenum]
LHRQAACQLGPYVHVLSICGFSRSTLFLRWCQRCGLESGLGFASGGFASASQQYQDLFRNPFVTPSATQASTQHGDLGDTLNSSSTSAPAAGTSTATVTGQCGDSLSRPVAGVTKCMGPLCQLRGLCTGSPSG